MFVRQCENVGAGGGSELVNNLCPHVLEKRSKSSAPAALRARPVRSTQDAMFKSTHDFETKIFREICTLLARLLPPVRRIAVRAKNACCVRSVRLGEIVSGAFVESVSVQIYYCNQYCWWLGF